MTDPSALSAAAPPPHRVVIDTNVLRAGVWSAAGASHRLLRGLPHPAVTPLFFGIQAVTPGRFLACLTPAA